MKVLQRSDSYFCYIVYLYCWRFDKGVVRVVVVGSIFYHCSLRCDRGVVHVVVILFTIAVKGLLEKWFMLLLYCIPLLLKVWMKSGPCFGCYIIYQYCLWFDRGEVHVVVVLSTIIVMLSTNTFQGLTEEWFVLWLLYCLPFVLKVWRSSGSCCGCCIIYHYCLRFDRGVVCVGVVILSTIFI